MMAMKKFLFFLLFTTMLSIANAQTLLNKNLLWDGNNREYAIYLPASYDGSVDFPLLFNFHGGNDYIASYMEIVDMRPIADTANFILVYPQAFPDPTDGGSTNWIRKAPTTFDDVPFVQAMIDAIAAEYQIHSDRVYACGYSLGGEFTFELACRLNDRIAAVGVVARTMGTDAFNNCVPVHPTGMLSILGTADFISPYNGFPNYYLSAEETHDYWATHNNCNTPPTVSTLPNTNTADGSTVEKYSWANEEDCTYVEHLKVINGGHDWPGSFGNKDIDASEEIWNFVSRYDLNGITGACTATTSIRETNHSPLSVFPNPFEEHLSIETTSTSTQAFKIYSILGELMMSGQLTAPVTTIDLSALAPNIYFLRTEDQSIKLIKSF